MTVRRASISVLALGLVLVGSCVKKVDDRGAAEVDFKSPKRVVSSIFYAAQSGQSDHLSALCDPEDGGNKHVQRICSQRVGGDDWDAFVEQFAKGKLIGEARISGDGAQVNFVFGPDGNSPETMELVRRGDKWYLSAF